MPTEFDNFTRKAWSSCSEASDTAKKNRQLLQNVMKKYGFVGIRTEWWHFDWHDWKNYPELDIAIEDLV